MKPRAWTCLIAAGLGLALTACGGAGREVTATVENAAEAAETGLHDRNLRAVEEYFATEAEGANAAGLGHTRDALRELAAGLDNGDQVQFHSFDVQAVEVHEDQGLARATYRLHFSVVRGGVLIYGAVVVQDLALIKTPRGWRISGGDEPTMSDVKGQWPPLSRSTSPPVGGMVTVVFLPQTPGECEFACPMGMSRGWQVVERT